MRVRGTEPNPFADLLRLVDPRGDGPVIGYFADTPISATVIDRFRRRFIFVGAASRKSDGRYDFDALRPGEWVVEPGLVYEAATDNGDGSVSSVVRQRSTARALRNLM